MSFTGLEDTVVPSLVTVDDHTMNNSAPLIQDPHLQSSTAPLQGVFPDRNDILYRYQSQDSRRLWDFSGDIPFCLWHDEGALENYCVEYLQRTAGTDTQIIFDLGIAHKHSDPSKVCFSVSTSQFWEMYWLNSAIPDNDFPPLSPTTSFAFEVALPLPAPQLYQPTSQLDTLGNLDTVYGLTYPDDLDNSYHSSSPLPIAEQEREIRPLPRAPTHQRVTAIRDYTFTTLATATKRNGLDSVDTPNTTNKRVKLVPTSPVASTPPSSSSLTDLSPSPPLSPKNDSPPPPRTDQPSVDEDLRCIYPDCCQHFPSVERVLDHHKSVHKIPYPGKYRCAFASCIQTFKNKADFERHAKTLSHQPEKGYLCSGCDMTFTRYDARRRHQKRPSGIKPECREEGSKEEIRHIKEMAENREKRLAQSRA